MKAWLDNQPKPSTINSLEELDALEYKFDSLYGRYEKFFGSSEARDFKKEIINRKKEIAAGIMPPVTKLDAQATWEKFCKICYEYKDDPAQKQQLLDKLLGTEADLGGKTSAENRRELAKWVKEHVLTESELKQIHAKAEQIRKARGGK